MITVSKSTTGFRKVRFVLPLEEPPGEVSVVGDFNEWRPGATPLRKRSNGTRSAVVSFTSDTTVTFRYLGSDGRWFNELDVPERDGENCVLTIG